MQWIVSLHVFFAPLHLQSFRKEATKASETSWWMAMVIMEKGQLQVHTAALLCTNLKVSHSQHFLLLIAWSYIMSETANNSSLGLILYDCKLDEKNPHASPTKTRERPMCWVTHNQHLCMRHNLTQRTTQSHCLAPVGAQKLHLHLMQTGGSGLGGAIIWSLLWHPWCYDHSCACSLLLSIHNWSIDR